MSPPRKNNYNEIAPKKTHCHARTSTHVRELQRAAPAELSIDAMISWFERTFCRTFVKKVLHNVYPNCGESLLGV
jgi:hypothetical protein